MDTSRADTGSSQTMNLGLQGQGPGDADPLAAAAVQLVGIGVDQPLGEAHGVHQLAKPRLSSSARLLCTLRRSAGAPR